MSLIDLAAEAYQNKLYNFSIKLINKYLKNTKNKKLERAYYYRALSREKLKHYKEALEDYNALLKMYPNKYKVYEKIAILNIKLFHYKYSIISDINSFNDKIIKNLKKALELKSKNKYACYFRYIFKDISLPQYKIDEREKEIILNKLNNFPKMYKYLGYEYKDEAYLKKAIKFDDYISYYNLAVINKTDDSIKYLEKAININPNYYKSYNALALYLLEKEKSIDNYKKAIEYLDKAIELNKYYVQGFFNRQKIKRDFLKLIDNTKDYDIKYSEEYKNKLENEITEDLKKAYELSNYEAKKSIKYYKVLGEEDDIIKKLSNPQLSFPKYDNVLIYIKMADNVSNYFEKIENYNGALNLDCNYYEAYNLRGFAKYNLGFYDDALLDFDKAIEINKNYADAYYNKGKVYLSKKKYNEAIEYFKKSKELYQMNDDKHELNRIKPDHYIAWCYYYLGEDIDKIFNENIKSNNEGLSEVYYNRGKLRYELGDYKKALEDFYKITDEDDKNYKKVLGYIKLCENKLNNIDDLYERCEIIFMLAYEYKNENAFYNALKFYEEVMNYTKEIDNNSSNAYLFYLIRAAAKIEIFNSSFDYDNYFEEAREDINISYQYADTDEKKEYVDIKRKEFNL
ncbi:tetratricopeptide repeat protein [Brachyspira alvinipulli]|uniref:tetratricopeptide repeat protein n=1 Tax=Brachyspira alvinipulli TaxID=84379 RepID=UPI003003D9E2